MFLSYYFGDWLKEQRELFGLTQKDLSEITQNKIAQNVISMWERKEIVIPSIQNILTVIESLDIPLQSVPWDHLVMQEDNEMRCSEMKERFSLYELPTASSIKTFEGKTYDLKGFVGIETKTGEVKHITDLYYRAKTVVSESKLLAKRKKENQELLKLKSERKINKK